MLAIGRALMSNPKLLVLDEATQWLAQIAIDKKVSHLLKLADRHDVIEKGRMI